MHLSAFRDRRPVQARRRKHRGNVSNPSRKEISRRIRQLNRRLFFRSRREKSIFDEGEEFETGAGTM